MKTDSPDFWDHFTLSWLAQLGFEVPQVVTGMGKHKGTSLLSPIWIGDGSTSLAWGGFGILTPSAHRRDIRLTTEVGSVLSVSLIQN